jgi:hypothetical protein
VNDLSHFNTDRCPVCNVRMRRGFHLGQWCPNEDNHLPMGALPTGYEHVRRVWASLPCKELFITGTILLGADYGWAGSLETARTAFANCQIWTADLLRRKGEQAAFLRLGSFLEYLP